MSRIEIAHMMLEQPAGHTRTYPKSITLHFHQNQCDVDQYNNNFHGETSKTLAVKQCVTNYY